MAKSNSPYLNLLVITAGLKLYLRAEKATMLSRFLLTGIEYV